MKEATRQLVLLIGIMTILTGALVTVNSVRTNSTDSDNPSQQINTTPEPVETENVSTEDMPSAEPQRDGNSSGIIVQ